ncbi:MAG: hypothetical protein II815_05550 [Bacteroidales bacterium]|nr:hypothetical protein [Bacteroidales bacterium]
MFSLVAVIILGILMMICSLGITVLYIVLGCIDGQKGENQYGQNPKEVEEGMNN